jgi:NADH/NAD ratio-sensing transcriptional regulator Rex
MVEQTHITARLPAELLERVEAYRRRLERLTRQPVSRAAALRALVDAGLEAVENEK